MVRPSPMMGPLAEPDVALRWTLGGVEVGCVRLAQTVSCPVPATAFAKERSAQCQPSSCASSTRTPGSQYWLTQTTFAPPPKLIVTKRSLVIGEAAEEVEGDLKSVWETLTGGSHPQAPDEHLTWTRRDPEED
jgi:hypothetical protein